MVSQTTTLFRPTDEKEAEELDEFNGNIVGKIEVIAEFHNLDTEQTV